MSLWYFPPHFIDRELWKVPANLGCYSRCLRSDFSDYVAACMLRVVLLFILVAASKAQDSSNKKNISKSQVVSPKCENINLYYFKENISKAGCNWFSRSIQWLLSQYLLFICLMLCPSPKHQVIFSHDTKPIHVRVLFILYF